jgi:ATP-dependent RNA helicase HrpA
MESAASLISRRAARRAAMAPLAYPPELPVSQLKDEIAQAIQDHQVVIIAGETGSGKTTQIPKICLELGRGVAGQIGHTQPRRLAARTVAERIAEELGSPLGEAVGYKVRFTDRSADDTLIKLMTDGILLTELARDRRLRRYDTLIIDEAHERSLNIDFILGCLRQLLPSRPDLKVIITSATIDPERFAAAFGGAPVVEVSGRTYPVEVRYRPVDEGSDQGQAISDAVDELSREGPSGDILVFLSGEREIRDTADVLAGRDRLEVLPLYSRLSAAEQHRVFSPVASSFTRRVVLATNVAETSLTVPGIRYVVDPGTARISRYSRGTKVQRLPIEPISQASANQRKGRCGRVADGICIRLYSEADFESRPEFTDPEILRTNLASVILQMAAIGLGDVPDFPFIDPPDARNIADGMTLLTELNAFKNGRINRLGRKMARLPVDPRIARMILESDGNGCAREVLIIAAALSIQDPRERPADAQEAADAAHRRFASPDSDFSAFLALWDYLRERQAELSSSAFRRMCRAEYLNYLRVREWQDLHGQLQRLAADVGVAVNSSSSERTVVHLSLLAGLLSQIGMKVEPVRAPGTRPGTRPGSGARRPRAEYLGARNARFAIFPGSGLARKPPDWLVAAELVETSRLFARMAAKIEPEWVEPLAQHLVRRSYSEPHWEKKRASAVALEKVTLYGIPLVADRKVGYGRIDPVASRELFIRHALVEGDWNTAHRFFHENRRLLAEAAELEHRVRRRGLVAGEEELYAFYDARIPAPVVSGQHFDTWWKQARREDPGLLTFKVTDLVSADADVQTASYPDVWTSESAGFPLPLAYAFAPGTAADGITAGIPLSKLNQVNAAEFSWQVPGLRAELVTEMIRSLPKSLRRDLVPAPDVAREVLARLGPPSGDIRDAVGRELRVLRGVDVPRDAWDMSRLPPHLRITFRVLDDEGGPAHGEPRVLASGDDLAALQRQLRPRLRARLDAAAGDLTRKGLTSWDFGTLPEVFRAGEVVAYPALADAGGTVDIRLFETPRAARAAMWAGTRRLILLGVPSPVKSIADRLPTSAKLALSHNPHGGVAAMFADCVNCAADFLMARAGGPARDRAGFERLRNTVRESLHEVTAEVVRQVEAALRLAHAIAARLDDTHGDAVQSAVADLRAQLAGLIYPDFVTATGYGRLPALTRYLRGMERRLGKLPENPGRDALSMAVVHRVRDAYQRAVADLPAARRDDDDVRAVRWMIEELRVSLFAQTLGTPAPVSENRILAAIGKFRG